MENLFDKLFNKAIKPLPAGIYSYQSTAGVESSYKWHLRLEEDGTGILVLNASTVLHLNQTAAEYAYYTILGKRPDEIARIISARYDVNSNLAIRDYRKFVDKVETLTHTDDLDPVTYLELDRVAPYSRMLSAPYRLDCALTYRLRANIHSKMVPPEHATREMNTDEWKIVLDKAWEAGIPHVIFTGGEPTLRDDLPLLISYTEKIGMVCGLLTDGLTFCDEEYLDCILKSGLDHIMLLADEGEQRFWKALKSLLAADIAVTVHATLAKDNRKSFPKLLEKIAREGASSISLSIMDKSLSNELGSAREKVAALGLKLVWDLPVPYSFFNPIYMELQQSGNQIPEGAGRAWLYVEPDGDVLPTQGVNHVLGNFLKDPFSKIWKRS